ncbi:hypothetical protein AVEN_205550-1 [Araneus ventricosus]|uniref:Reverse transcriptase/retrotransposon-derived protein RNase H-like domain-containing protein n=1 Tax=Araneus ventricosus TaxID=182803 RepID=A0A4Y2JNR4_ARAVE|nr:hypothetical protein AVEN_205550-1 [Araneus ventricosus]
MRLIANATALSFPAANVRLSLMTDASDFTVGAILQEHIESTVEPLGFFSGEMFATEKKYSTFDRAERTRTTAYHPQSNGAVERFHRHQKRDLMTHLPENWLNTLPLMLLGFRTRFKQDLATSSAELVYGATLKLPEVFLSNTALTTSASSFLQMLRHHVRSFRPIPYVFPGSSAVFARDHLVKASHVFLIIVRKFLEPPYAIPYKVKYYQAG